MSGSSSERLLERADLRVVERLLALPGALGGGLEQLLGVGHRAGGTRRSGTPPRAPPREAPRRRGGGSRRRRRIPRRAGGCAPRRTRRGSSRNVRKRTAGRSTFSFSKTPRSAREAAAASGKRRVSVLRVELAQERVDARGNRRVEEGRQLGLGLGDAPERHGDRVRGERVVAAEELVEDRPHREEVRAQVELLAARLLGRHVGGRPDDRARHREPREVLGVADPEVADLHGAVLRPHDVLRLDVAVHDALLVRGGEAVQRLVHGVERDLPREAPRLLAQRVELAAVDVLHDDVRVRRRRAAVHELDDVRVLESDLDADLVEEAVEEVGVRDEVGEDLLDRDPAAGALVDTEKDLRHPAEREPADDRVVVDPLRRRRAAFGHDPGILRGPRAISGWRSP